MNKDEYLNTKPVIEFMYWIKEKLDKPGAFPHTFSMKKPALGWTCDSIYSAYENYNWNFCADDPITGSKVSGYTFAQSMELLSKLSKGLRQSIDAVDNESCKAHCLSILQWGGVKNNNDKKVIGLGNNICHYLIQVKKMLKPDACRTESDFSQIIMNSGFTKIYSLLIDAL